MKKTLVVLIIAAIVLSGALPAAGPMPSEAAPVDAPLPPTPTPRTPSAEPAQEGEREAQSQPTPPDPGDLSPGVEKERAREAIEAVLQKRLDYWGPRYRIGALEVDVEGEWAHGVAEWQGETRPMEGPIHVLARRDESGVWQALMPNEEGLYLRWVEKVPEALVLTESRNVMRSLAIDVNNSRIVNAPPMILSDGQFVYGSNVGILELNEFLRTQSGILKQDEYQEVINDQATYFGINPKVMLTVIEMQSGLVTARSPQTNTIASPIGYVDISGFIPQIQYLAERLNESFYWHLYVYQRQQIQNKQSLELTLADGTRRSVSGQINAGTYALYATLAEVLGKGDWDDSISLSSARGFYRTWHELYPSDDPLDASNTLAIEATPPSDLLKLPFSCNDTWKFFEGPHDWNGYCLNGSPDPRSSVDFGPGISSCTEPAPTDKWITAAADGTVASVSCGGCMVVIDHGNNWQTRYYHVLNAQVSAGQQVSQDTRIGNPSCRPSYHGTCGTCNGSATAPHVHFAIYQNGYQPIDGTSLEGWIVHETGCYAGYLQKDGVVLNEERSVTSQCGTPPSDQVKLWSLANYEGNIVWSGGTGFSNGPNADSYSMEIPGGWSVKTWTEDNRGGSERCWSESVSNLQDHGWHLAIQSIEVFDHNVCSSAPQDPVTLYEHPDYNGSWCALTGAGWANVCDGFNDVASSVRIEAGWSARLYEHSDRNGSSICFSNSDSNFSDDTFENGGALDNQVSSFEAFHNTSCTPPCNPPSAPSLNSPSDGADLYPEDDLVFDWSGDASEYQVHWWGGPGGDHYSDWMSGTSWDVGSQQESANKYYWEVKGRNGPDCEGDWSTTREFTIVPQAPTNLNTSVAACDQIDLSWSDNSNTESDYHIERSPDGSGWQQIATTSGTSYQDSGLGSETTYYYRVRAHRHSDDTYSAYSNTDNGTTPACATVGPLAYDGYTVDDDTSGQSSGNNNGIVECGETIELYVDLYNQGDGTANGINATISTDDSYTTWLYNTSSDYPDIAGGGTGTNSDDFDFEVDSNTPDGHTIQFDLDINASNGGSWSDSFDVPVTCVDCNDTYEPNNTSGEATPIAYGQTLSADICPSGDYDFYEFTGTAGDKVVVDIDARSEGSSLDSYIYLLDDDGTTVLAQDDDEPTSLDSHLGYELPDDGTYYIRVRDYWDDGGTDYTYSIHLLTDAITPTAEIISPEPDSWIDPSTQPVNIDVNDNESGVRNVKFYWHDADWENSDWILLEDDWNPSDGWTYDLDTGSMPEQAQDCVVFIYAYDWAGNQTHAASYHLGIDRTPPSVTPDAYPTYGDAPFRDFWVNWWNSYDNLSGIASYDVQYQDGAAGAWTDLAISTTQVYTPFVGQDDHTYYFRARARDHAGNISTYSTDEVSHTVDICETAADAYEFDGSSSSASWITPDGYSQIHNIHTEEDADWVKFEAQAGITYTLTTGNTGDHADTVLELYDTDGSTLLAENDDCPGRWPASCLDWQAPSDGTYYVKVYHWDEYAYGCTTEYGLSIVSNREPSLALGEPGTSFRYTETMGVTEQAYVPDTQHLNAPNGLFIDTSDNLYVVEELGARLLKYRTSDGTNLLSIGTAGLQNRGEYTFDHPQDVAVDSDGNIWAVDRHRVAQYDASGNFLQEFPPDDPWNAGDDNSHFDTPRGIAFDSSGRMYVSDSNNHRIQVYTFDVDGTPVYSTTIGVTDEPGDDDAHFDTPGQIVINSGDSLYVADVNNHRVQHCSYASGWTCSTIHGTGSAGDGTNELNLAYGLGIDNSDHIYIADSANGRIKECISSMFGWYCNTFASGLGWPAGVAVDSDGHVYVSDFHDHTIREYDSSGSALGVFQGDSGTPYVTDNAHFNAPYGVAVDSDGSVYVTEDLGYRLIKLNAAGEPQWSVGEAGVYGDDNAHFGAYWRGPTDVALDSSGNAYVADTGNHRIQIYDSNGGYLSTLGGYGSGDYQFQDPYGVAVDNDGNIYVADEENHRVQIYDRSYAYQSTLGVTDVPGNDNTHFSGPKGVAVDADGYVYVADAWNRRVQKCAPDGSCTTFAGVTGEWGEDFGHFWEPRDVAVDDQGRVYVADIYHQRVQVFDSEGAYLTTIGNAWGSKTGELRHAAGVAVDDQGNLYVADELNARVQKFALGVPDWQQVNINGLGAPDTEIVNTLAPFDDQLYAGTYNPDTGAQLWRKSADGAWAAISTDGLGDADNIAINHLAEFKDQLYAGTWANADAGGEVWRSSDGTNWNRVVGQGFGDPTNAEIFRFFASDNLYAGTCSYSDAHGAEIWRSYTGDSGSWSQVVADGFDGDTGNFCVIAFELFGEYLYAGTYNTTSGAEVWRSNDGTSWHQVNADGFGDADNQSVALEPFDGYLYAGTRADPGAELWRCQQCDGSDWEQVSVNEGLGDADNRAIDALATFADALYAFTDNRATGMEAWRTEDGTTWEQVGADGLGDSNNYSPYWDNSITVFDDHLHIGTRNPAHGGELWQSELQLARADFDASPAAGTAPLTVDFTNTSTGDYDTCTWDFGDDTTSSECGNPSHEYTEVGAYTVTLTVSGTGGMDSLIRTSYITTYEAADADFTADPTQGVTPLTVEFTNQSIGDYDTCAWDFGDGETSDNCNNPDHTYDSADTYTVKLTISGAGGEDTYTCSDCITVHAAAQADFIADRTSGTAPLTVDFTNTSTGDYDTCTWDFGDDTTSSECGNISHTYEQTGSYTVRLTIDGDGGSDVETKLDYIVVTESYSVFLPLVIRQ